MAKSLNLMTLAEYFDAGVFNADLWIVKHFVTHCAESHYRHPDGYFFKK